MIPNTTTESRGIVTTKISAALTSMVNAMIIAPNTMHGERRNRRRTILTPFCTWLISLVILVIRVEVPMVSISVKESPWIWENNACRSFVENPTAAFAAKYCAVAEHTSPIMPRLTMSRHMMVT